MVIKVEQKQQDKSFYKAVLTVLLVSLIALSLTRVVLANILATSGQRLAAANQKSEIFLEQNQKLENEVSSLSSLDRVESLAQKLGMVKAENVQVLTPSLPIANR